MSHELGPAVSVYVVSGVVTGRVDITAAVHGVITSSVIYKDGVPAFASANGIRTAADDTSCGIEADDLDIKWAASLPVF